MRRQSSKCVGLIAAFAVNYACKCSGACYECALHMVENVAFSRAVTTNATEIEFSEHGVQTMANSFAKLNAREANTAF